MDPITIIVTALALGAAAGIKSTAEQAVKDAYNSIKALIHRKYPQVSIDLLESDPTSLDRQMVMKEGFEKTEVSQDEEVLLAAKAFLDIIVSRAPYVAPAIGVDLEDIKGASLKIEDIIATGKGVKVKGADIGGDIAIKGVKAGSDKESSPKV